MAGFHTKTFELFDDYMTPTTAWNAIVEYIPKDKIIWEAFYGDATSGNHLTSLGFQVIHEPIDFFNNNRGDIIISNPPFSMKKEVFTRLKELDKPFIMICPTSLILTQYFRELFGSDNNEKIQIIIPRKRIQFIKLVGGVVPDNYVNKCNFDCFYYCYKINLPKDIIFLNL
jgi:hypothetical protein